MPLASGDEVLRCAQDDERSLGWQLLLVFAISLLVLCGLIAWLQNVHIITSNGMYKSIQAEPWIADPAHARLDPSHYLYFPLYRALARVLGALFTLGWLIEWRLMFPTLPALILALALAEGRPARRLVLIGTLIVSILIVAGIVQLLWEGHNGAMGLHDILWTGKGITTGWAGLSADKAWMMLSGIGNYFLIVGGWVDPLSARRAAGPLVVFVLLQAAIFFASRIVLWPSPAHLGLPAIPVVFMPLPAPTPLTTP